ncbi:MAG: hypothetical protein ACLQHK_06080 [Gallionellaceae bacterium]
MSGFSASTPAKAQIGHDHSVNTMFLKMRQRFAEIGEQDSPLKDVVAPDESCFGPLSLHGKRGRGAYGNAISFMLQSSCHAR